MNFEHINPDQEREQHSLTRDEVLANYREQVESIPELSVELPEVVTKFEPRFIQEEVAEQVAEAYEFFKIAHGFTPEKDPNPVEYQKFVLSILDRIHEQYTFDENTKLPNKSFVRKNLHEIIDSELRNESRHTFDHVAHISIDLNGLKAVNDLNGGKHSFGDLYIHKIAEWLWKSDVLQKLKVEGNTVLLSQGEEDHTAPTISRARTGGDEFSVTIIGDPDAEEDWKKKWKEITAELESELAALDVSDVLHRERVAEKLPHVPEDWQFQAGAGIGVATLEEVLADESYNPKNIIYSGSNNEVMADKLMGRFLDISDERMDEHKSAGKKKRAFGSPHEKILFELDELVKR